MTTSIWALVIYAYMSAGGNSTSIAPTVYANNFASLQECERVLKILDATQRSAYSYRYSILQCVEMKVSK